MSGMSQLVKDATRLFAGFILTFGLHVVAYGPGGGFAGGVIVAGAFVLLMLAYGSVAGALRIERLGHLLMPVGALVFLLVACLGLTAGTFFQNYLLGGRPGEHTLLGDGTVLLSSAAIGLTVWMSIATVFLGLSVFHRARPEE